MTNRDQIEFYDGGRLTAVASSSMVPPAGALISIRQKTYEVIRVTYALDHADKFDEQRLRANVDLRAV